MSNDMKDRLQRIAMQTQFAEAGDCLAVERAADEIERLERELIEAQRRHITTVEHAGAHLCRAEKAERHIAELETITDEMVEDAHTAYEESTGDYRDWIRAALEAAMRRKE